MSAKGELGHTIAKQLLLTFSSIRLLPHLIVFALNFNNKLLMLDIKRWADIKSAKADGKLELFLCFINFMTFFPEYRNQFYKRIGWRKSFLQPFCSPLNTLYIHTKVIGGGLFIQHGFSTIIVARKIGVNCHINQQVTIGYSNATDCPTIGDNVVINAGAKVIGGVTIGNNVRIGANAVVVKSIPENCTVVGVPAYIIRENGVKCKKAL